jgi:hypothetical protein
VATTSVTAQSPFPARAASSIDIIIKVIVIELYIQDGEVSPHTCCIIADPAMLIERRTDDDMVVAGAREEQEIRL